MTKYEFDNYYVTWLSLWDDCKHTCNRIFDDEADALKFYRERVADEMCTCVGLLKAFKAIEFPWDNE